MKHTIVFDLEATCWEGKAELHSEIIEVGAVKLDADGRRVDTFQTFVRPTTVPVLSEYCTQLTSIRQEDVADAPQFHEAMAAFEGWIGGDADLVTWGQWDKTQILQEAESKAYSGPILAMLDRHINLKQAFTELRGTKAPCGIQKALRILNIPFEGTQHRGIDDAINTAKIWKVYSDVVEGRSMEPIVLRRLFHGLPKGRIPHPGAANLRNSSQTSELQEAAR